jgi:hypothetical protein
MTAPGCWVQFGPARSRTGAALPHLAAAVLSGALLVLPWLALKLLPSWYVCTMRSLTGVPCPFCGFTRAFGAVTAGHLLFAARLCPLAVLAYAAVAAFGVWHAAAWLSGGRMRAGPGLRRMLRPGRRGALILLGLLLANWAYRITM